MSMLGFYTLGGNQDMAVVFRPPGKNGTENANHHRLCPYLVSKIPKLKSKFVD